MGFFDRFLTRAEAAPLPELNVLLEARGLGTDLPGLAALVPGFELHRKAEEREAWVAAVAELQAAGLPLPEPWIDAQDHLLPELVPTWQAERDGFWNRSFIEGLSQRICVSSQPMPSAWLTLWDQSADEVMGLALDHLSRRSEGSFERLPSGIYRSPWRDGLDAARLLLPEIWHGLFKDQHPFLAIPTADTLLATPQILLPKLMDEVGRSIQAGAKPLQLAVLERIDDQLMTARLQDPHPMSTTQRELKHMDLMEALRQQESALDPALGRPATVAMLKTSQGKPMTLAVWNEGTPVLLPETDLIGFTRASGEPLGIYARQTLPRIHEMRGQAVDIWGPRRVRYDTFPSLEQIGRLEQFATAEQMKNLAAQGAGKPGGQRPGAPSGSPSGGPQFNQGGLPKHLQGAGLGVQGSE